MVPRNSVGVATGHRDNKIEKTPAYLGKRKVKANMQAFVRRQPIRPRHGSILVRHVRVNYYYGPEYIEPNIVSKNSNMYMFCVYRRSYLIWSPVMAKHYLGSLFAGVYYCHGDWLLGVQAGHVRPDTPAA